MQAIIESAAEISTWSRVDDLRGVEWFEDICEQQKAEWAQDWLERNHSNLEELEELCFSAGIDTLDLLPLMIENTTPAARIAALRGFGYTSEVTGWEHKLIDTIEEWVMLDRGYRKRLLDTWGH